MVILKAIFISSFRFVVFAALAMRLSSLFLIICGMTKVLDDFYSGGNMVLLVIKILFITI